MAAKRSLAGVAGFAAAAGLGYGAVVLGLALARPAAEHVSGFAEALSDAAAAVSAGPEGVRAWPALFGEPEVEVAPAPAGPARSYTLLGLVIDAGRRWAIVGHDGGETLVREGALLPGGETVRAITPGGVVILRGGVTETIGFGRNGPKDAGEGLFALAQPLAPRRAEVPLSAISGRDLRRVFGRAGSVRMLGATGADPASAEILWVRPGEILERIGLRAGDRVLRVNGFAAGDLEELSTAAAQLSVVREYEIALRRSGVLQTITVVLTDES